MSTSDDKAKAAAKTAAAAKADKDATAKAAAAKADKAAASVTDAKAKDAAAAKTSAGKTAATDAKATVDQPLVQTGVQSAGERTRGDTPPANTDLDQARRPAPVEDVDKGVTTKSDVAPRDEEKTFNSDQDPDTVKRQEAGVEARAATQTKESAAVQAERDRVVNLSQEQVEAERDERRRETTDETGVKIKGKITRVGDDRLADIKKGQITRTVTGSQPMPLTIVTDEQGGFISCKDEDGNDVEVPLEFRHLVN